ncbi:hypothetical protein [Desulfohalovibrio reitneri]|uniref:hypothetical protein n=1 Tax=Desulfohalovibrio reitneri TaxID=1307759 RepID=UPI00068D05A7|nr:hypothetical protein [Desulfohalovibrio reitneri]
MRPSLSLTPLPFGRPGRALLGLDPRVAVLVCLAVGLLIWRVDGAGLPLLLAALGFTAWLAGGMRGDNRVLWRGYLLFVLGWSGVKLGLDLLGGTPWPEAAGAAGLLGGRLVALLLVGLSLALISSPRGLGAAFAWYLRAIPLARRHAWKAALSLALMIHFLPLIWQVAGGVSRGISLRLPEASWRRRAAVFPQALIRALSQKTWSQTVAVAARGLDGEEAWRMRFPLRPLHWLAGLAAVAVVYGMSLL